MEHARPFRFMDLPKELRLMVYERLPRQIKHINVKLRGPDEESAILITKSVPITILSVSRTIYEESKTIVENILKAFILEPRPKCIAVKGGDYLLEEVTQAVACEYLRPWGQELRRLKLDLQKYGEEALPFLDIVAINGGVENVSVLRFIEQAAHSFAHWKREGRDLKFEFIGGDFEDWGGTRSNVMYKVACMASWLLTLPDYRRVPIGIETMGFTAMKAEGLNLTEERLPSYWKDAGGELPQPTMTAEVWAGEWLKSAD